MHHTLYVLCITFLTKLDIMKSLLVSDTVDSDMQPNVFSCQKSQKVCVCLPQLLHIFCLSQLKCTVPLNSVQNLHIRFQTRRLQHPLLQWVWSTHKPPDPFWGWEIGSQEIWSHPRLWPWREHLIQHRKKYKRRMRNISIYCWFWNVLHPACSAMLLFLMLRLTWALCVSANLLVC